MMKKIISVLLLFISFTCFSSDKVSVSVQPSAPIVNEPFDLIFKIKLSGDEEPYISFDPGGASVTGRSNRGVSLKTTIINGKYTTSKEVTYVYSLLATRSGSLYLKNIKVDFGAGVSEKVKNLRLNVLREPKRAKDIFVMAVPSKDKVYVGEGFDVNYYLYQRVNVLGSELEKYPSLGDFLKRFHLVNETIETVKYKGELYRRSLKYSARLFAQKPGKAKLDPLKMKVQYSSGSRRSSFGFGIQLGQVRTRSFQSERIEIEVLPLPVENVPPYFTGLVGEHEFNLKFPRTKYVVNEAIEAKLEVQGVGALEAFEAPKLLKHKDLEEFDTKGELQPINNQVQKKMFEYTYLARSAFDIEEHIVKVAYFDPIKKQYITKDIVIPKVSISGGAVKSSSYSKSDPSKSTVSKEEAVGSKVARGGVVGINLGKLKSTNFIINIVNVFLFVVFIFICLSTFLVRQKSSDRIDAAKTIIKSIYKGDQSYSSLYSVLNLISDDVSLSITEKIKTSKMSDSSKSYFLTLLESLERGAFSTEEARSMKVKKKHFKELQQVIK